jgi:hypothetical protein
MRQPPYIDRDNQGVWPQGQRGAVLRVLALQSSDRALLLRTLLDDAGPSRKQRVPEPAPVFHVVIDEQRRHRIRPHVPNAPQPARVRRLRLGIDRVVERLTK